MVRPVIDKLLLPLPENYKNMSSGTGSTSRVQLPAGNYPYRQFSPYPVGFGKNESGVSGPV